MDERRRTLLCELYDLSLDAAVERLLDLGVLDSATLAAQRDEHLREWRSRSLEALGDELDALRRQARQQRRHAAAQIEEARRQRELAEAATETIVRLAQHRHAHLRRHGEQAPGTVALDSAHRALGAALAAQVLLAGGEPYPEAGGGAALVMEEERVGARIVLRLAGEIDISTAPQLQAALEAATKSGADEVWVDLVGVRFIDSTGISALLRATIALSGPRRLAVICPDGPARRALELCGIGKVLALYGDRSSAAAGR